MGDRRAGLSPTYLVVVYTHYIQMHLVVCGPIRALAASEPSRAPTLVKLEMSVTESVMDEGT
jgi:hypothetical protein